MATHVQVTSVVEKDDACCTGWIGRLTKEATDQDIGSSRLVNDGRTKLIEAIAKGQESFRKRAATKIRATVDDDPSRLAAGMGVDDTNCLHGGISGKQEQMDWKMLNSGGDRKTSAQIGHCASGSQHRRGLKSEFASLRDDMLLRLHGRNPDFFDF
jgi:hypothetical protein